MPEEATIEPIGNETHEVKIFDFQDFAKERGKVVDEPKESKEVAGGDDKIGETPKEEPAKFKTKEEIVKPRVVESGEEANEEVVKVPEVKVPEVKTEKALARDYSTFDPEDQVIFKKVSNEAFERITKLYSELKEIKSKPPVKEGELPNNYLAHPKGFLLSPHYEKVANEYTLTEQIANHWKEQAANIKYEGKWQNLSMDDKGNLVKGEIKEADKEGEIFVHKQVEGTSYQAQQFRQKYETFINDFSNKAKADVDFIKNVELKFFPGYEKPDHVTNKYQTEIINALPESQRALPLASLVAKTGAALNLLNTEYQKVKAELDTLKGIKKDIKDAPPTKGNFAQSSNSNVLPVTMDDFRKERQRR